MVRFAAAIKYADALVPEGWEVTVWHTGANLNVGRLSVLSSNNPEELTVTVDSQGLAGNRLNVLKMWGKLREFGSIIMPEFKSLDISAADIEASWPDLEELNRSAIRKAATTAESSPYAKSHSTGFVQMLADDVGLKVFDPPRRLHRY